MPDGYEIGNQLNLNANDGNFDPDNDGLSNRDEYDYETDPQDVDTDKDGMPDGYEVEQGFKPNDAQDAHLDPDNDGLNNLGEYLKKTDSTNHDTDGDGIMDGTDPDPLNPPSERRYYEFTLRELASIAGIIGGITTVLGFILRFVIRRKK